jgi:hypothetical protein
VNTLPDSLVRYEDELEQAVARDLARRPRRFALRVAVVGVAAAAVALGVLSTLPGGGASAVERAQAALAVETGTILHVDMLGRQVNPDGSVATWEDESWQLEERPFTRRQVETSSSAPRAETTLVDGVQQLYDAATNTIYTTPPQLPPAGPVAGEKTLDAKLKQLPRAERERLQRERARKEQGGPVEEPFRDEIVSLLRSGDAREDGRETVDGRDAVRLVGADGHTTYFVDAATYAPIRLVTVNGGATTTLSFRVYELLDAAGNEALVSLQAQHPDARVDASPEAYQAAQARLFPHG